MARPPKPGAQKRTSLLRVRVTKMEKQALENIAKEDGLNVSDWIRGKILGARPRLRKPNPDREIQLRFLAHFGKIGSLLNQMARQLNRRQESSEFEVPIKEIEYLVEEIKEASSEIRKIYNNGDTGQN